MAYKYNNGYGAIVCDRCNEIICTGDRASAWAMADEVDFEDVCDECKNKEKK